MKGRGPRAQCFFLTPDLVFLGKLSKFYNAWFTVYCILYTVYFNIIPEKSIFAKNPGWFAKQFNRCRELWRVSM